MKKYLLAVLDALRLIMYALLLPFAFAGFVDMVFGQKLSWGLFAVGFLVSLMIIVLVCVVKDLRKEYKD